jgi:hypothetical protein
MAFQGRWVCKKRGHFNASSYSKYDQTLEAQTGAAERCVLDNISYSEALELETRELRHNTIEGLGSEGTVTEAAPASGAESSRVGLKRSINFEELSPKRGKRSMNIEGNTLSRSCLFLFAQRFGRN